MTSAPQNAPDIVVLQMDSVLPKFQSEHGDYPDMFQALLGAARPKATVACVDVRNGVTDDIPRAPAYLLTGSKDSVYDQLPWLPAVVRFLRAELEAGKKVVGICFGHQLLAHFFGGRVAPAAVGWVVGAQPHRLTARPAWIAAAEASQFTLLSSHQDQVVELPHGAQVFATTKLCPYAGFTVGDQVMTLQSHPEFSKPYAMALLEHRRELLGGVFAPGVESLQSDVHEARAAAWIWRFVEGRAAAEPLTVQVG